MKKEKNVIYKCNRFCIVCKKLQMEKYVNYNQGKKKFLHLSKLLNFNFIKLIEIIFRINGAYTLNKKCKRNFKTKIT